MKQNNTHQEINQELIGLGAHRLVDLRGSNGFINPKDLKESVHDVVLSEIDEEEFSLPTNFFNQSRLNLIDQLPAEKPQNKEFKIAPWTLSLAAAAILAFVFFVPGFGASDECESFDCLLAQTDLDFSDYELLYADGGDLSELMVSDELFIDITEQEAIEYLLDSDIETEELW